jgi:predicted DNA-binding transcriptional regulator AlpA
MSTVASPKAVLSAREAATYLSLSRSTFLRLIANDLPRINLTPGRVGYAKADLDQWIAGRREAPAED